MEITFKQRGIVGIDDCEIIFKNFAGNKTQYNRNGKREFALKITDPADAEALIKDGWNVRIKDPRVEGENPRMHLPINVNFNDRGPNIWLNTGIARRKMKEDEVHRLDFINILSVNMDIAPHRYQKDDGSCGKTAYLRGMEIFQDVDRFDEAYAEEEYPEE